MLTQDELKYLEIIPASRIVSVKVYDPAIEGIVNTLIKKIRQIIPEAEILFMGAAALKIAGQNDIDLHLLTEPANFEQYTSKIVELFGEPTHKTKTFIEWDFIQDGFDVEFYISDTSTESMKRQIKIFNILKNNHELRMKYEDLKLKFNGKKYKEYQKAKYEFYNEILLMQ